MQIIKILKIIYFEKNQKSIIRSDKISAYYTLMKGKFMNEYNQEAEQAVFLSYEEKEMQRYARRERMFFFLSMLIPITMVVGGVTAYLIGSF